MLRRTAWISVCIAACVGAVAVTTLAVVDHVQKTHALRQADVSAWYCVHRGIHCGERKPQAIEDAWNERERWYKIADVAFILIACIAVVTVRPWRR